MSLFRDRLLAAQNARRATGVTPQPLDTRPTPLQPISGSFQDRLELASLRRRGQALGVNPDEEDDSGIGARFLGQVPEPIREGVGGALRGLASALEPLQLPQDTMFAIIAGSLDSKSTITERLQKINFKDYAPGGEAPVRPASGEEIFSLMGFSDDTAKWAGIAADLVADPLVAGAFLRVAGKLSKAEELVSLGNKLDHFISPLGMATSLNRVARRSQYISDFQDARIEQLFSLLRNPDSSFLGIQNMGIKIADAADFVLPRDVALRLRLGDFGTELFHLEQRAEAAATRTPREVLHALHNAKYNEGGRYFEELSGSYLKLMEGQSESFLAHLADLPQPLIDNIELGVYAASLAKRQAGFAALAQTPEIFTDPSLRRLAEDIQQGTTPARLAGARNEFADTLTEMLDTNFDLSESVKPFRDEALAMAETLATRAGLTAEEVAEQVRKAGVAFDRYLHDTISIDARLGLAVSGYNYVSTGVRTRVLELGGTAEEAQDIWLRVLSAGMVGGKQALEELKQMPTQLSALRHSAEVSNIAELERKRQNALSRLDRIDRYRDRLRKSKEAEKAAKAAPKQAYDAQRAAAASVRQAEEFRRRIPLQAAEAQHDRARAAAAMADSHDATRAFAVDEAVADIRSATQQALDEIDAGIVGSMRDVLFGGFDDLPARVGAATTGLKDLLVRHTPPALRQSTAEFDALSRAYTQLDKGVVRYQKVVAEVMAKDNISRDLASRVIKAEENLVRVLDKQVETLTAAHRKVGTVIHQAGRPRENTPSVAGLLREVAQLRADFGQMVTAKVGLPDQMADIKTAIKGVRSGEAERLKALDEQRKAANAARAKARADEVAAAKKRYDREKDTFDRWHKDAKARWKAEDEELTANYQSERQRVKDAFDDQAVLEAAERKAEGLPKPGSRADLTRVAMSDPNYQPRPRLEPQRAVPLEGGNNTTVEDIYASRLKTLMKEAEDVRAEVTPGAMTRSAVLEAPITFGELLDGIGDMQALDLGDFLSGLMTGHLRRAYGMFIDGPQFQTYINKLKGGDVHLSRLLDEAAIRTYLGTGFEREADLLTEYIAAMKRTKGSDGALIIRTDGMIDYLQTSGIQAERVKESMKRLQSGVQGSDEYDKAIGLIEDLRGRYGFDGRRYRDSNPAALRNRDIFEDREFLPEQMLEDLGEYAMSSMSLLESASFAGKVIKRQELFQEALTLAKRHGMVKHTEFMNEWGTRYKMFGDPDVPGAMGGWSGMHVNPMLIRELERFSQVPDRMVPAAFSRLRSLITGGYLAAPAVLTANFVGGFYQAWTAGINPLTMMRRMREVLPDMVAASRSEQTDLMRLLREHLDIDMTGLVNNNQMDDLMRLVTAEAGMGPEGMRRIMDNAATWYEEFLQRPGIGKFRAAWAGLEGFQFTENWFKVAAFKETLEHVTKNGLSGAGGKGRVMLSKHDAAKYAAEAARNVVFDYSTLPRSLEILKQSGVVMFPGFPYFLAGRTVSAVLNRPGVVAISDRITEALMNASLPVDEQILAYIGMADHLQYEQGSPLPFSVREGTGDNKQVSMIPVAQLVPTATIWDGIIGGGGFQALGSNPWAESISQLGMWGPLYDIFAALTRGDGEATISGRFGHVVFEPGAEGVEKAANIFRFLYNTMAPSVIRRGLRQGYDERWEGLVPAIPRAFADLGSRVPEDFLNGIYTIGERRTGRPETTWRESVISSFLRTPQVVALEGPLAGIRTSLERERRNMTDQVSSLEQRYRKATAEGQVAYAEQLMKRIIELRNSHHTIWGQYLQMQRAYEAQRRRQRQGSQ